MKLLFFYTYTGFCYSLIINLKIDILVLLNLIYIGFSLNGELLMDALGGETTFAEVQGDNFVPAFTLGVGQKAKLIFGQDVTTLKYFTTCGLQEGYEPFCV